MSQNSVKSAILIASVGNAVPAALGFLSAPVLARAFSTSDRGELAAATSLLLLATSAMSFGIPESLTFHVARRLAGAHLVLKASLLVIFVGSVVWIALVCVTPVIYKSEPQIQSLVRIALAALIPTLLVGALRGIAIGQQRWWLVTVEKAIGAASRLGALVVLVLLGELSQYAAVLIVSLSGFFGGIVYVGLAWRGGAGLEMRAESTSLKTLMSYGSRVWVGSLTGILLSRLDQAIMAPIAGSAALGIYVVAATIVELALVLNSAVSAVMFSKQSSTIDDAQLGFAARVSTLLTALVSLAIAVAAPVAVPLTFGPDYYAAIPVLGVLLLGVVLANPGSVAGAGLNARGRPGLRSTALLLGLAVNVLLLFPLGAAYGALGAAIATLAGTFVAGWMNIVFLRLFFGIESVQFMAIRLSDLRRVASVIRPRKQ
ncbi:hypothetical protein Csp2054_13940 [Curtobacterium sp. 'Ferrero']|uniref:oligosaccharide flippase family protein n=1 Tax=Curtobacterium sp. 'Ferrero' TaxID=2033654 RepID=UPI000BDA86CB|nr:oligosaccharide flippase family protein [Curtobacterium sp. 'Ferrero']PCN47081.1 hypothetical protein Csp2054_13940 [Curtobacterium sp. 'Ferrero']